MRYLTPALCMFNDFNMLAVSILLNVRPYRGEARGGERERPCSGARATSSHQREAPLSRARAGP